MPRKSTQALAGVLSALAALGVGHAVAAAMSRPAASPLIAVGSVAVDAAPTPVKEIAVRLLGNWDKPVLISGIGIVLLVAAAGIGLLAWRRPRTALVAIGALGLVGSGAALLRAGLASGGVWSAVPSIVAGAVGVAALALITRASQSAYRTGAVRTHPPSPTDRDVGSSPRWPVSVSSPPSAPGSAKPSTAPDWLLAS